MKKTRRGRKRIVKQIITFTCFSIFSATAWYNVNSKELAYNIMAKNDQVITLEEINSVESQEVQLSEQTVEVSKNETKVEEKTQTVEKIEKNETNQQQSRAARRDVNIENEDIELTSRSRDISSKNEQIVNYAKKYIGGKYVWGANGPNAFDCSGFTQYVFSKNGIGLNRTAAEQAKQGVKVSKSDLEAGDLLFFKKINSVGAGISHVAIYIGNGKFIHASNPRKGIRIDNLNDNYYTTRFHSARRVIG